MNENLQNIDKLFRNGIEGQEETPSPGTWNAIDKMLDKKKVDSIAGKYNKLKWVAAALFIFSFAMGMYVYHVHKNAEVVKNNSNREPGLKTFTGKKPFDAAIKSAEMTIESKKNILREKPADRPAETDRLPNKDLPTAPLPITENKLTGKKSPGTNEKEILHHDPVENKRSPSAAPGNPYADASNDQHVQKSATISVNKLPEVKSASVKALPRQLDIARMANDRYRMNGLQKKSGKQDRIEAAPKTSEKETRSGLQAELPELRAALLSYDLAVLIHPEISVCKSCSKPGGLAPLPILPSSNKAGYIQITQLRQPRFSTTVFFSPNAVSNSVASTNSTINRRIGPQRMGGDYPASIKDEEKNGSSWSAGALLGFHFNGRWSIESGLVFSTRNTITEPKTITAHPDDQGNIKYLFDCSSGFLYIDLKQVNTPVSGDTANAVSSKNKLQYLSVPIVMKYSFGNGKLHFNTGFGLQTNFLVSHKIDTYVTKGNTREYSTTGEIQGLRPVYISGLLSAGLSYKLSNIITAGVTPNAQIGFMSINGNAPVKSYINFYGIAAGINIKL